MQYDLDVRPFNQAMFRSSIINGVENADDSTEVAIISASTASKALETVQTFLIQQENANKYLRYAIF